MTPLLLLFALTNTHAGKAQKKAEARHAAAMAQADQATLSALEGARDQYRSNPAMGPNGWAALTKAMVDNGAYDRGSLTDAHLDELVAALKDAPADAPALKDALGNAAAALTAAGRADDAQALVDRGFEQGATAQTVAAWLAAHPGDPEATARCQQALAGASGDIPRYDITATCNQVLGTAWTDQTWFDEESGRRAASQAAHDAKRQAEDDALFAQMEAEAAAREAERRGEAAPEPSGPVGPTIVDLNVSCRDKVRLFEGARPDSGGTRGWQSGNSRRSISVPAGHVLCISDARDQPVSCWTAPGGGRASLEMTCTGFLAR